MLCYCDCYCDTNTNIVSSTGISFYGSGGEADFVSKSPQTYLLLVSTAKHYCWNYDCQKDTGVFEENPKNLPFFYHKYLIFFNSHLYIEKQASNRLNRSGARSDTNICNNNCCLWLCFFRGSVTNPAGTRFQIRSWRHNHKFVEYNCQTDHSWGFGRSWYSSPGSFEDWTSGPRYKSGHHYTVSELAMIRVS